MERPVLAPGVTLAGEMKDSAFQGRQWLVEREGRFAQVTELLYRVAEQADGRRACEEIAGRVADVTGRHITATDVHHLVTTKLAPAGLVLLGGTAGSTSGGSPRSAGPASGGRFTRTKPSPIRRPGEPAGAETAAAASRTAASHSALALNLRMALLSPQAINPVTRVLQHLYWPPILVAALVAVALTHWWLYAVHGVASGVQHLLFTPALVLLVYGMFLVSAVFHEFGHAAALRYGGGRVRGMGAGLYLVYPAFFTDVTDNYRLGRWARVRTDLGGFYFNLLFALGLFALYARTGWEFLLLGVMLVDLEIVHQLLPLVRLDGYWLLADLTGIPDFFSLLGPLLRSVLPVPWWKGAALPPLKTWVKAVFLVYVATVLPLLSLLLFTMVRNVPRVLATAWASQQRQMAALVAAHGAGDALGQIAAALQMATLALPVLGLVWMLFTLGRSGFGALWRWSRPTPAKRLVGTLATAVTAGVLALLWVPQVPQVSAIVGRPSSAQARYEPIGPQDRGTIGEALAAVPGVAAALPAPQTDPPLPAVTGSPSSTPSPATAAPQGAGVRAAPSNVAPASEARAPGPTPSAAPEDANSAPAATGASAAATEASAMPAPAAADWLGTSGTPVTGSAAEPAAAHGVDTAPAAGQPSAPSPARRPTTAATAAASGATTHAVVATTPAGSAATTTSTGGPTAPAAPGPIMSTGAATSASPSGAVAAPAPPATAPTPVPGSGAAESPSALPAASPVATTAATPAASPATVAASPTMSPAAPMAGTTPAAAATGTAPAATATAAGSAATATGAAAGTPVSTSSVAAAATPANAAAAGATPPATATGAAGAGPTATRNASSTPTAGSP